jgi:hypothetical protein
MNGKWLFIVCAFALIFNSCKKDNSAPAPTTGSLLDGKWYKSKIITRLYSSSGTKLDSTNTSAFTTDDFVTYYPDGTGYYSESTSSGISVNLFNYTLSGLQITVYISSASGGLSEAITTISQHNFSLHVVELVPDPNDPDATDTEISDYYYFR